MARETKVGLLAGLAFIICFAIILANGGRQKPATRHLPYLVDQGANVPRSTQDLAYRTLPPSQRRTQAEPSSGYQSSTAQPISGSHPVRIDQLEASGGAEHLPGSGAEVALPTRPLRSTASRDQENHRGETNTTRSNLPAPGHRPPGVSGNRRASGGSPTVGTPPSRLNPGANAESFRPGDQEQRQRALQDLLDRRTSDPVRQAAATGSMRQTPPRPAPQEVQQASASQRRTHQLGSARYKVKPGDTLSRIAFAHYGSRSSTVINGIFEANRSALSTPDLLPVGVELVLPVLDGLATPRRSNQGRERSPTRTPRRTQQTVQERRDFRWYQVERDDRYVSIAREQLGDASRWREIFELNKDKFPNPDRIRHGVRIKLPLGPVASAEAQP